MPAAKPLLFLDVDGVLSCPSVTGLDGAVTVELPELALSPEHRAALANMGLDGAEGARQVPLFLVPGARERLERLELVFEIVWATAWRTDAPIAFQQAAGVGGAWEVLGWGADKLPAILERAQGRPWAWLDDDIDLELEGNVAPEGVHLLERADASVGLTDKSVERLVTFALRQIREQQVREMREWSAGIDWNAHRTRASRQTRIAGIDCHFDGFTVTLTDPDTSDDERPVSWHGRDNQRIAELIRSPQGDPHGHPQITHGPAGEVTVAFEDYDLEERPIGGQVTFTAEHVEPLARWLEQLTPPPAPPARG